MKDGMEKMLMAKSGKQDGKMSPEDVKAKMEVLHELLQMAQHAMGGKVKHGMDEMQKVSVMAPDHKSLEAGLDKAKELMGHGEMGKMETSEPDDSVGNHEDDESISAEEKAESLMGSGSPEAETDDGPDNAAEEAAESPQEEEEEQNLFSKKPSKEMPKKKKLFSMED